MVVDDVKKTSVRRESALVPPIIHRVSHSVCLPSATRCLIEAIARERNVSVESILCEAAHEYVLTHTCVTLMARETH